MDADLWAYRARLDHVVDGDTVDLTLDLGFRTYKQVRVRLAGIDTAEIYGTSKESQEYQVGMDQKAFVIDFLNRDGAWPLRFESYEETGKYGRWVGDVSVDGKSVTRALLDEWPDAADP